MKSELAHNNDIIRPSSKSESNFYEKWEDRKKRKAIYDAEKPKLGRPVGIRRLKQGGFIDVEFIRKFTRLYNGEMSVKRIAVELACGTNTVNRLRRELNLPHRINRRKPGEERTPRATSDITVWIEPTLLARVDAHVWGRYRNRSAYIRKLLQRDLADVQSRR